MYSTCPKCGYQHGTDKPGAESCPECGLIYAKWLKNLASDPSQNSVAPQGVVDIGMGSRLANFFLPVKTDTTRLEILAYGVIWITLAIWGWDFIAMDYRSAEIMNSWFHNVDLVFHEAGHMIFMPFGRYMMFLGGSLFQVLLPIIFVFGFLLTSRDAFAASVCLWWAGQSLMDLAPYIADARALRMPLLGGGTGADRPGSHDWANLLRPLGLLNQDTRIAAIVDFIGSGVLLISLAWGAYMLLMYYRSTID